MREIFCVGAESWGGRQAAAGDIEIHRKNRNTRRLIWTPGYSGGSPKGFMVKSNAFDSNGASRSKLTYEYWSSELEKVRADNWGR
jgi:hypothetical protein